MPVPSSQQPSLGRLRRRARALIRQPQDHDPAVADLLRIHHPAFADLSTDEIFNKPLHLSDAQLALSREQGHSTWPQASLLPAPPVGKPRIVQELIPRPEYRRELAARRGLPPIGTRQASCHSIEYTVVDYAFVLSQAGIARAYGGEPTPHIDELLPMIDFKKMSPRLVDLYTEVDRCTSKGLLFFDTMPDAFPRQAAPGVHEVRTTQDPCCITFHFDASRLHETIIAHELGHLWIEFVEGCEDWRNLRDQSDIPKIVQFQHIQSFVLDLKVNDLLQSRGFDMSVIDNDQLESIREMALHCAKGNLPKTKRMAAALANTIAATMLEQKRWPKAVLPSFQTCLATIQAAQPEIYRLAEQFVASIERHGYADHTAIGRVVNECATLSFQATGDDFDPTRDLVEERPTEWMADKRPDFLPRLPVAAKLDVWKAAARHGLGAHMRWELGITASGHAEIRLQNGFGNRADPVKISLDVPLDQLDVSRLEKISVPSILPPTSPQRQLQSTLPVPSIPPVYAPADILPSTGIQMPVLPMALVSTLTWQNPRRATDPSVFTSGRNYMAGVGLWLSRAGFKEQTMGEHPYAYAQNNPVMIVDPLGRYSCRDLANCLYVQRERCTCSGRHDSSPELMLCLFWQEDSWGPGNIGEGPGNCTEAGCFSYLTGIDPDHPGQKRRDKCSYLRKYKSFQDFTAHASLCEKIWAAQDFLGCVGLKHYGPGPHYPRSRIKKCEACIQGGSHNIAIANDPTGYPCAIAPCCVTGIHS